ncbi:histidine phosphatase family protein [Candidatus Saccharibacteria bacterium]|nr:histidine phosphatase family protein [Candidatus Saccharibacteria bacterium]
MTKVTFVRHGQTNQNIKELNGTANGEEDDALNETGINQVKETAEALKNETFDIIISSPYQRATQTAAIINKYHNVQIRVEEDFRERDGGGVDAKIWHDSFDFDTQTSHTFDGEPLTDFFERVYTTLDKIKENHKENAHILIVAHGGVYHALRAYFKKLPWKGNLRVDLVHNGGTRKYEF